MGCGGGEMEYWIWIWTEEALLELIDIDEIKLELMKGVMKVRIEV